MKRPNASQSLALRAAAAAADQGLDEDVTSERSFDDSNPAVRSFDDETHGARSLDDTMQGARSPDDVHHGRDTSEEPQVVAQPQEPKSIATSAPKPRTSHEERWSEEPPVPDHLLAGDHDLGREPDPAPPKGRGRPAGKRDYAARQTVYLDDARHNALKRMAKGSGRSVHSLLLEGIDKVIGKPEVKGWE